MRNADVFRTRRSASVSAWLSPAAVRLAPEALN
jgi:hypothetical protein